MHRSLLPHLGELLLRHRLDQLVVKLKNSLEVVKNILTGNCIKTQANVKIHCKQRDDPCGV